MTERISLHAGGRAIQLAVVASALVVATGAFAAGAPALVWAMATAGVPGLLAWTAPVVVDAAMVVAAAALVVRRSQRRGTAIESIMLCCLVALSAAVQVAHALLNVSGAPFMTHVVSVAVAGCLPLLVLAGTETAGRAVLAERPVRRAQRETSTAPAAEKVAKPKATSVVRPSMPAATAATLASIEGELLAGTMSLREGERRTGIRRERLSAHVKALRAA